MTKFRFSLPVQEGRERGERGRTAVKRKRYQVLQSSQTCNINSNIFNSMHFCGCVLPVKRCQLLRMNIPEIPDRFVYRGSAEFVEFRILFYAMLCQIAEFQSNVASDWLTCAPATPLALPLSLSYPACPYLLLQHLRGT